MAASGRMCGICMMFVCWRVRCLELRGLELRSLELRSLELRGLEGCNTLLCGEIKPKTGVYSIQCRFSILYASLLHLSLLSISLSCYVQKQRWISHISLGVLPC